MATLGACYAQAALPMVDNLDGLFGPAYKGIPLATAAGIALQRDHGKDLAITLIGKSKNTRRGGILLGAPLDGDILIVDDVITAGTAIRHSVDLIREHGANPVGVVIGLDRCERGIGEQSAVEEVQATLGLTVTVNMHDIIDW